MPLNTPNVLGKDFFFTEKYKVLIRSNREFLIRNSMEVPIVDRAELHANRFDIYRFLDSMKVEPYMKWTVAYLNDIINPSQDISGMTSIRIVDEQPIAKLIARSNTVKA